MSSTQSSKLIYQNDLAVGTNIVTATNDGIESSPFVGGEQFARRPDGHQQLRVGLLPMQRGQDERQKLASGMIADPDLE